MNKVILPRQKAITIFLVFALGYYISNLLRAITATISPNLISEFNLSAGDLGLLGGGYFLGFAAVQIPLGYLLDKVDLHIPEDKCCIYENEKLI